VVGNGVATLVVSRWQGELDVEKMRRVMAKRPEIAETNSA
jgi:aerobic C4-dicarboxylate transport protein